MSFKNVLLGILVIYGAYETYLNLEYATLNDQLQKSLMDCAGIRPRVRRV